MSITKKNEEISIRSSAAEYLTFIAASGEGGVEAVYADEDVWLSQKMMGELYQVETQTINYHLKKIFSDSELEEDAVIRKFRITAETEFEKYRMVQDRLYESDFDKQVLALEQLEKKLGEKGAQE